MNKVTTDQQDQHAGCAAPCMAVLTAHIIIPSPRNFITVTYYILVLLITC